MTHLLDLTELRTMCVSKYSLPLILKMCQTGYIKHLRTIICFDSDLNPELVNEIGKLKHIKFMTFESIISRGKSILDSDNKLEVSRAPPNKDSVYLLSPTSGTLGIPKCSMITHQNLLSTINSTHALGFLFGP